MSDDEAGPVCPAAPPERIGLPGDRALVRVRVERAPELVAAVNASLDHLHPWMAWAAEPATEPAMAVFLASGEELWDQRRDFSFHVVEGPAERLVGGCGLHGRHGEGELEIGYWVHAERIGLGIATDLARALTSAAFAIDGIERVHIQCEEANVRSARIPDKLGYAFQGVHVPDAGVCEGRRTQAWELTRSAWMATTGGGRP